MTFGEQLDAAQKAVTAAFRRASPAILSEALEGGEAHYLLDGLEREMGRALRELSDDMCVASREAVKATQISCDLRLTQARRASAITLQNKASELEAAFHRQIVEQVRNAQGSAGAELERLGGELLTAKEELGKAQRDVEKLEAALDMAKRLHRASERRAEEAEAELAGQREGMAQLHGEMRRCMHLAKTALSRLHVPPPTPSPNADGAPSPPSLDQYIQQLVSPRAQASNQRTFNHARPSMPLA